MDYVSRLSSQFGRKIRNKNKALDFDSEVEDWRIGLNRDSVGRKQTLMSFLAHVVTCYPLANRNKGTKEEREKSEPRNR